MLFLFKGSIPLNKVYDNFYPYLPEQFSKYYDLKFYDISYPDYTLFVPEIINRLYKNDDKPDIIYYLFATDWHPYYGLNEINIYKILHHIDIHSANLQNYLVDQRINLYLTHVPKENLIYKIPSIINHQTIIPAADENLFKFNLNNKKYDLCFANTIGHQYDIRNSIFYQIISDKMKDVKTVILPARSHKSTIYEDHKGLVKIVNNRVGLNFNDDRIINGENYGEFINQSKCVVTCTSFYKYPIIKIFEALASGSLLMCDKPHNNNYIGLIDGVNYCEINENNFYQKLRYYLINEDKRLEIVKNAYNLFLKHHTFSKRIEQMVDFFSNKKQNILNFIGE